MNRNSKADTSTILEIFTTFLSTLNNEQYDKLLNKKGFIIYSETAGESPNLQNLSSASLLISLKSSTLEEAKKILAEKNITKECCIEILQDLNIKVSKNCKKETLTTKILDTLFKNTSAEKNELINSLLQVTSREEAQAILKTLKVAELKSLAVEMKITLAVKNKADIINCIVQRVIGNRLDRETIMSTKLK